MDILFCGDPHNRWEQIVSTTVDLRPEAIVLLGDMGLERPLEEEVAEVISAGVQVWWIHGNHDCDKESHYDFLFNSGLADRNLHGRVVEIAGTRVAGLGGVFRKKIWYPNDQDNPEPKMLRRADYLRCFPVRNRWREGIPLRQRASIFPEDFHAFKGRRADVLVTHEAPSCHRFGAGAIDGLAEGLGAHTLFHGHHHEDYVDVLSSGVKVVGVGMAGVCRLDGSMATPGLPTRRRVEHNLGYEESPTYR